MESPRVKARPWRERNRILDSKIVSESCGDKHIISRINDNRIYVMHGLEYDKTHVV